MKNVGKFVLTAMVILALVMTMTACSKSSSDSPAAATKPGTTPDTASEGAKSSSASLSSASMAQGSMNLGQVSLSNTTGAKAFRLSPSLRQNDGMARASAVSKKIMKTKAVLKAKAMAKKAIAAAKSNAMFAIQNIPETIVACSNSGSMTISGTFNDIDMTFNMTMVADFCKEINSDGNGYIMDGIMEMTGSETMVSATIMSSSFTVTLGTLSVPFTNQDFGNGALIATTEFSNFTVADKKETDTTATLVTNGTMTQNGNMSMTFGDQESFAIAFTNLSIAYTDACTTKDANDDCVTGSFTGEMNGSFTETFTEEIVKNAITGTYVKFKVKDVFTPTTDDLTISGSAGIVSTPSACGDGIFTFTTQTAIHYDYAKNMTTAGEVTIAMAGDGSVTLLFNADGTITVTDSTGSYTYDDMYNLQNICPFASLDEPAPTDSGASGSASGNTMTITSLSSDTTGSLDCYTDLHVNYYATAAPTATTAGTWYVDYHTGGLGTSLSGVAFEQGIDIDNDTYPDVGLDINGGAPDNTSGGLEHFIATQLPAGYYVVSMNNWSCPVTVMNDVSIQIGSSTFGPYVATYTAADYDGTTPGAWFAVADIVVDSAGNAQVNAHDTALPLWHELFTDGTYTMTSGAKKARGMK